jgi:hypothetical protein
MGEYFDAVRQLLAQPELRDGRVPPEGRPHVGEKEGVYTVGTTTHQAP